MKTCKYKGCTFGEGNHVHLPCDENCNHENTYPLDKDNKID